MGILERKLRQKEQLRSDILVAARELAREKGWESVSTRKVAEKVEYSTTVIYEHFGNKEALLHALQVEGFVSLRKKMEEIHTAFPNDATERLIAISKAKWRFAVETPEIYQVMFSLGGVKCGEKRCEEMNSLSRIVKETLEEITGGELKEGVKMNWVATLHGFIALHLNPQFHTQSDQLETYMVDAVRRFIHCIAEESK